MYRDLLKEYGVKNILMSQQFVVQQIFEYACDKESPLRIQIWIQKKVKGSQTLAFGQLHRGARNK